MVLNKYVFVLPDIINYMLKENEKERPDILELAIITNLEECLLAPIITPFSEIFKPIIINEEKGKKIIYTAR